MATSGVRRLATRDETTSAIAVPITNATASSTILPRNRKLEPLQHLASSVGIRSRR
jgi:hypothetical protein